MYREAQRRKRTKRMLRMNPLLANPDPRLRRQVNNKSIVHTHVVLIFSISPWKIDRPRLLRMRACLSRRHGAHFGFFCVLQPMGSTYREARRRKPTRMLRMNPMLAIPDPKPRRPQYRLQAEGQIFGLVYTYLPGNPLRFSRCRWPF